MIWDKDNLQEIFYSLKSNRLRTFLTAFGVFWGIFMLIVLIGAGRGLYKGVTYEFRKIASNSVFIWPSHTTKPYRGFNRERKIHFINEDIDALKDHLKGCQYLAPRAELGGQKGVVTVTHGAKNGVFSVYGDFPDIRNIQLLTIASGRFINDIDIRHKRKIAVIGRRVKTLLFEKSEDPIGRYINIHGVYFKVAGVFSMDSKGDDAERDETTVFIPFTAFQQAFNYVNRLDYFAMTSEKGVSASDLKDQAVMILAGRHGVAPDDDQAFGFFNMEKEFQKIIHLLMGIHVLNWMVGVLSLLAGVIGVSNIMLIVVKERTREIGIKRAIGATPFTITVQIVIETLFLTILSGYAGLIAGVSLLEAISWTLEKSDRLKSYIQMFREPSVTLDIALTAFCILVVSGIAAGLAPARKAVQILPVEAIREL